MGTKAYVANGNVDGVFAFTGVSQSMHIAKLSVLDDGQTHNDGPAPARRRRDGGKNHARHPNVQAGKTANGGVRLLESHNHVDAEYVEENARVLPLSGYFFLLIYPLLPSVFQITAAPPASWKQFKRGIRRV